MAYTAKWTAYSSAEVIGAGASGSTSLNALADSSWATSGATLIDNSTALNIYADIEVSLASSVSAGDGSPHISVFIVPVPDGTNVPTPPGATADECPGNYWVGSIYAVPNTDFTSGVLPQRALPPGKYVLLIQNNLGANFPASAGNVVNVAAYSEQSS